MSKRGPRGLAFQAGGPTPVFNKSIEGLALTHRNFFSRGMYGSINGPEGIVKGNLIDLYQISREGLEQIASTPGAALGSSRIPFPTSSDIKQGEIDVHLLVGNLIRYEFTHLFGGGGNGTAAALLLIKQLAKKEGYDLKVCHVPKTVDNDLLYNDHTPGWASSARYCAIATAGADLAVRSMPRSIMINVTQGRDAGWLAASTIMAREMPDSAPHLIYVPERPFDKERFITEIEDKYRRFERVVITVAEGIRYADGKKVVDALKKQDSDKFTVNDDLAITLAKWAARGLNHKGLSVAARNNTYGYTSWGVPGVRSEQDAFEARMVGMMATEFAVRGHDRISVTINRAGDPGYVPIFDHVPIERVAAKTRLIPDSYFDSNGQIRPEVFIPWARPLVGGIPKSWHLMLDRHNVNLTTLLD